MLRILATNGYRYLNILGLSDMKYITSLILFLLVSTAGYTDTRVADTVHNLSTSGSGQFKSQSVTQICAFCHTPHKPALGPGLWNRRVSNFSQPYQSSTAVAEPGTLGGSSVLCLSCHDGTIALGEMLKPPRGNGESAGNLRRTFLTGRSRFGTNLSNHHPIGFNYSPSLHNANPELADPNSIDLPLEDGEMQCTVCHDPHSTNYPPFLHKPSLNGELCTTCHIPSGTNWQWETSAHAVSDAEPRGGDPWRERKPEWKGRTVAENACENCHTSHNAATPQRLISDIEERTCFRCHNGSVSEFNIQAEIQKFYRHPVEMSSAGLHDSARHESPLSTSLHVECEDCHNPHATRNDLPMISFNPANPSDRNHSEAPFANGSIAGVTGLDINGQPKAEVEYEYEVCFKCHGVPGRSACGNRRCSTATIYQMNRLDNVYNLRDKVDSGNPSLISYHPIDSNNASNNAEVPSLRFDIPLNRISSKIYCGDCHNNEFSAAAGGRGPSGPHGSRHEAILTLGYELNPERRFNMATSGLCLKCHDVSSLFSDESFKHRLHVLDEGASCVNCHDPHGSAVYPHLINFLTSSTASGRTLEITGTGVFNEPTWEDNGRYSGTCYLNCHGVVHDGSSY